MRSFLFVIQTSAYGSYRVQEVLDLVLITAAFDQKVSLLLLDDAIFHLKKNQLGKALGTKDISAISKSVIIFSSDLLRYMKELQNFH